LLHQVPDCGVVDLISELEITNDDHGVPPG
jgi:hypothetical protein